MTIAILLPMSIVPINREGVFTNRERIFAQIFPCLFSNSIFSLLAERKAISIPEKKAENNKAAKIIR